MLDRPPPRLLKSVARAPLVVYRLGGGRLLGHRFLVIVHRGRSSGSLYQTVVEVVRWTPSLREAIVASGFGTRANWYRNLVASPAVEIWIAGERFVPSQRLLGPSERADVLRGYRHEHPWAIRLLGPVLGVRPGDDLSEVAERLPMVAFRPR